MANTYTKRSNSLFTHIIDFSVCFVLYVSRQIERPTVSYLPSWRLRAHSNKQLKAIKFRKAVLQSCSVKITVATLIIFSRLSLNIILLGCVARLIVAVVDIIIGSMINL